MADKTPEIIGMPELRAAFERLRGVDRVARIAVVAGGRVLKEEAKHLADSAGLRRTGALINNIVIKREKTPEGIAEYHLGVRHSRAMTRKQRKESGKRLVRRGGRIVTRYDNDPFYWKFHEFGHKVVVRAGGQQGGGITTYTQRLSNGRVVTRTKKWSAASITGRRRTSTRMVEAKPFIRPALENKRNEALQAIQKAVEREIRRQAKKR